MPGLVLPRDWLSAVKTPRPIGRSVSTEESKARARCDCQISERSENSKYIYGGFKTLRDLTVRRLMGCWKEALDINRQNYGISRIYRWNRYWKCLHDTYYPIFDTEAGAVFANNLNYMIIVCWTKPSKLRCMSVDGDNSIGIVNSLP